MVHKPKIAVLGPEGTFSWEVAASNWGEDAEYIGTMNFTHIFEKVNNKEVDIGVIPTEDSESGDVQDSFDLLEDYPLYIIGELYYKVKHFLLGKETTDKLTVIGSHKKPLSHCRKYLFTHFPDVRIEETASTAVAAKKASEDPTYGAIGSEGNAKIYGLNILANEIHDKGSNETRFLVISPRELSLQDIPRDSSAKTSIAVHTKRDVPGVLVEILSIFAKRKINLTRIVSRPDGGTLGNSNKFFLDLEGRKDEPNIKSALQELEVLDSVMYYRDFGSYSHLTKQEIPIKEAKPSSLELLKSTFAFWINEEDKIYDTL